MPVTASVPSAHAGDRCSDGLRVPASPAAIAIAEQLASIFGEATIAVLHYGSRAQGRAVGGDSAFDFFVIVTRYPAAYRAAALAVGAACRPRLAVMLARLLPPNAFRHTVSDGAEAKCLIISLTDFQRECSVRARDHFVQARMVQTVRLAWARDGGAEPVLDAIRRARDRTFEWVRVFLPPAFDLPTYCQVLIAVSFRHELRAEARGHPDVLYGAQRDLLHAVYRPVLARRVAAGHLQTQGDAWRQRSAGWWRGWWVRSHFAWSRIRTTARLLKHPLLYDDWLGYLLRKVHRSTGQRIALTAREQRHPLIFLWPRVFHYLRRRPDRGPS
jgi:hypothetical protein